MKNYKKINGNTTTYFVNNIKKYTHSKDSNNFEVWVEYDKKGNETYSEDSNKFKAWTEYDNNENVTYYKNSDGIERWSDDHPKNPKNIKIKIPKDFKPFTF